jgi:tRNA 5-methylaminomethyl-2-thiouridine biosynthesis bifunctional protein
MSTPFTPIIPASISWNNGEPYSSDFKDIYFSSQQGLDEAMHVFIQGNDLPNRWRDLQDQPGKTFTIGELGFGSGLNFLLASKLWMECAHEHANLHYISSELHPLTPNDLRKTLNLWPELNDYSEVLLESYPVLTPGFHHIHLFDGRVKLTLMLGDSKDCYEQLLYTGDAELESELRSSTIDAWFLDGFSPANNPSMWNESLFAIVAMLSGKHTTLSTFSCAGHVRRALSAQGFDVSKVPGHGRKREMVAAKFIGPATSIDKPHTSWAIGKAHQPSNKNITVLGAGLAGCFLAHELANRGWEVTLIDKQEAPGQGASGNEQAVLFPNFSAYRAPLTEFMLSAFLHAVRRYLSILTNHHIGELEGILQLAVDDKELNYQRFLKDWLTYYPELGRLVTSEEGSTLCGLNVKTPGLFIPLAGWMDSNALCHHLMNHPNISWHGGHKVDSLSYDGKHWNIDGFSSETLVITSGFYASMFQSAQYLPIKPIRGQMTQIESLPNTEALSIPVCGKGHVLPSLSGKHWLGATYHLSDDSFINSAADNAYNLQKLSQLPINVKWSSKVLNDWQGIRASSPDYLPMVGALVDEHQFMQQFQKLSKNAKQWINQPSPSLPGLYVMASFGSRGLTSIPLCAEWLAGHINHEVSILPRSLIQAIAPSRFLKKQLVKQSSK